MRMMFPFLLAGMLAACGEATDPAASAPMSDTLASQPQALAAPIDLEPQGLPLLLVAPDKQYTDGVDPLVRMNEQTGLLEVRAGDHFALSIAEDLWDPTRIKGTLSMDPLRKNTILREEPDLLVIKSEFPDDPTLVRLHFVQVVRVGDRSFLVQDLPEGRFNQQDIDRMTAAVSPKQPA